MAAHAGHVSAASPKADALAPDCIDTGMMSANNIWWSDDRLPFVGIADPDYARADSIEAPF